jgi:hypothetical protein
VFAGRFATAQAAKISRDPSVCTCAAGCVKYTLPPTGWEFRRAVDSGGNDIGQTTNSGGEWQKLTAACDAAAGCVAANTGGWLKRLVGSTYNTGSDDPCSGLLVRTGVRRGL